MSDGEAAVMDAVSATTPADFFDHEPTKQEKIEMKKANKRPSEWFRLLCKDWASENEALVDATDMRFVQYKPYLKGMLSSQLLCRLTMTPTKESTDPPVDFLRILGIEDEFDKAYIVAQVERFCAIYSIRSTTPIEDVPETPSPLPVFNGEHLHDPASIAAAAAAGINAAAGAQIVALPSYIDPAVAAAAASDLSKLTKKQVSEVSKAHRMAKDAEKALENERKLNMKREQQRLTQEKKEQKQREREAVMIRKAAERAARDATREERRKKKVEIREQRDKFAQEQKEAALKRAAELVSSNRVPIEITRGAAAAKAAASAALAGAVVPTPPPPPVSLPPKKSRSAIVVSTAADLHQIVTHSKNLWAKYNAIAKEHNQKVNWITVAKELGIHVKVREKYARMHSRAEQRGFDWEKQGHLKIKDHPEIFLEPTQAEQKAKMPPPPPDTSTTVLIDGNKEVEYEAVVAAAAVVDAAGVNSAPVDAVVPPTEEQTAAAAAVAATLVADPTASLVNESLTDVEIKQQTAAI